MYICENLGEPDESTGHPSVAALLQNVRHLIDQQGWFLTQETRRGKNADTGVDGAAGGGFAGVFAERAFGVSSSVAESPADESSFASQRGSTSGHGSKSLHFR
jgi:hypothetical protein